MQCRRRYSSSDSSMDITSSEQEISDEQLLSSTLAADIERFAENTSRLRTVLLGFTLRNNSPPIKNKDPPDISNSNSFVQLHSSLALVSKSVRDLLCQHSCLFKTTNVLVPASELVHAIKAGGATLRPDCSRMKMESVIQFELNPAMQALDRLENAVANSLRDALKINQTSHMHALLQPNGLFPQTNGNGNNIDSIHHHQLNGGNMNSAKDGEEEGSVKSTKANSSSGVSSSPNGGTYFSPIIRSTGKIVRRHSAFQLSSHRLFMATDKYASPLPRLSAAGKIRLINDSSTQLENVTSSSAAIIHHNQSQPALSNSHKLQPNQCAMWEMLAQRSDGMELAFDRCKAWSKFASQLLAFARSRLNLEQEYGQRLQKMAEQQLASLFAKDNDTTHHHSMPLQSVFSQLAEAQQQFASRADATVQQLQRRFMANLENRQKEHDACRRKLKSEYAKQRKQMESCADELRRARQTHTNKGEQYLRAREITLRQERECHQLIPSAMQLPNGQLLVSNEQLFHKRRKEVEKKRRAEEEALNRKSDAEQEVCRLERELDEQRVKLAELQSRTIHELTDLIRQCELTTIASTAHLLKALSTLWAAVPHELERLADASRDSRPGQEFMAFLEQQQQVHHNQNTQPSISAPMSNNDVAFLNDINCQNFATTSSTAIASSSLSNVSISLLPSPQQQRPGFLGGTSGETLSLASVSSSMLSPSRAAQRRNALTAAEELLVMAESQHQQKCRGKIPMVRLFDTPPFSYNTTSNMTAQLARHLQLSEACMSHRLQRTRQVTKCAQCEHLLIFDALKCQCCGLVWHRKCLPLVKLWCGPSAANRHSLLCGNREQRRTSIFGVSLKSHLEAQQRHVPQILEQCVYELQRRGMNCKGIYRTCGVKSKVEEICFQFEQSLPNQPVDLSDVHPMNVASVVKLYFRRLPEPLLTYELYSDWLQIETKSSLADNNDESRVNVLRELVRLLPEPNFYTLRFLMLHLNRVTWFELQNLMTASNLAAVIAPSLLWHPLPNITSAALPSCISSNANSAQFQNPEFINDAHRQTRAIELLIRHAFNVFEVDKQADWSTFFADYPDVQKPPEDMLDPEFKASLIENQPDSDIVDDELLLLGPDEVEDEEEGELLEDEMELLATDIDEQQEVLKKFRTQSLSMATPIGCPADSGVGSNSSSVIPKKMAPYKKPIIESSSSDMDCGSSAASTFRRFQQQQQQFYCDDNDANFSLNNKSNNNNKQRRLPPPPFPTMVHQFYGDKNKSTTETTTRASLLPSSSTYTRRFVAPGTAPSLRRLNHKQRSFTTSILVSPLADRRNMGMMRSGEHQSVNSSNESSPSKLISQKPLEEKSGRNIGSERANAVGRSTLLSGEVTVQLGQDCLSNEIRPCLRLLSTDDVSYV